MAGETRKEKEKRAQKDDERRAAKRKEADLPGMIMQARTRNTSSLHQPRPAGQPFTVQLPALSHAAGDL